VHAKTIITRSKRKLQKNSPGLLAAVGASGTLITAYLVGKASFQACDIIRAHELEEGAADDTLERVKENTRLVWKLYVPSGVSCAVTIGCIFASTRIGSRRTAAMAAAYSLSEHAFREYREKVVEHIGEKKEMAIRDEIAANSVANNPPKEIVVVGAGSVLCCELHTKRYFLSDMQSLSKAQNEINFRIVNALYVTLDDFYDLIGLDHTLMSDTMGWDSDRLLELDISTILSPDGRPCIAFSYNYLKAL
jgi:hypothetical protein